MICPRGGIILSLAFLFLFSLVVYADPTPLHSNTSSWVTGLGGSYSLDLTYTLCPSSTGNTTLHATVATIPSGVSTVDANVFATIQKPDSSTSDVNFTNNLSGDYTYSYNFDQNGTYFIQAHVYHPVSQGAGDTNGYVYLGDLNWTVAFLNNDFEIEIGETGTIRNTVTNSDGNLVYDINANTTIYYPSGSVADANAAMTQTSDGEFVKAFFGPSPAGDYTVSSIFKCGSKYVANGSGTFTVTAADTGGGDDGGSGGGGGSGDSGGGSGGGGGGGGGSITKKAQIIGFDFSPVLSKNAASVFSATVQNLTAVLNDYVIQYTFTHPDGSVYSGEKSILAVAPYQSTTVVLDSAFIPPFTGVYLLDASLRSTNKIILYDKKSFSYDVQGERVVSAAMDSPSNKTASGLTFPFNLTLYNGGDFPEGDIKVDWHLEDSQGEEYFTSSFITALSPTETKTFAFSPFIPLDVKLGTHTLFMTVTSSGVTQIEKIVFDVVSPNDYYAQFVADLEVRIDLLEDKIDELQSKGFDVDAESLILLDLKQELGDSKGMLLSGNFAGLNIQLLELSEKVTKLAAILDNIEQQAPLLSREGLTVILYVGAGLLLAFFLWFVFTRKHVKEGLPSPPVRAIAPKHMDRMLGIDVTYYPSIERQALKHKPLISDLLGLKERK